MRTIRYYISIALAALIVMSMSSAYAVSAISDTDEPLIRVAVPVSVNYEDMESDAAYVSYITEYLHEISQHTGWICEIIKVPGTYEAGLQSALDMLKDGTADLLAPISYIDEISGDVYFSQNSFATATTVLQIPNSVYQGFEIGSEIRVAAVRGNGMEAFADQYFERNQVAPQYIYFRNVEEQIEAVCSGAADVMLNADLESIPNTSIVAEFAPVQLYFAATDQALLQELDQALLYIRQANTSFSAELYEKYVCTDSQTLTLEETSFIEQAEPFVVAVLDHNEPYQYYDAGTDTFCGIGVDLLNYISEKTGLRFEFVAVENWDELMQLIQEAQVQIVAQIPYDYAFAAQRDLTITRSYVSSPYMLAAESGFQGPVSGQRLALMEVSSYTDGQYVGDVIRYTNMGECVEAIRSGEADYTYLDLYTAQYYLGDARYSSFGLIPQSYTPHSVCFGLTKPTDNALLSVLNKAISQISDAELQSIITKNVNPARDVSILSVIITHPVQSLILTGLIGFCISALLAVLLWWKSRMSVTLRKLAMEDGLTHLYHASACRKLVMLKLRQMAPAQCGAFIIMDLDDFKQINDKYGHQKGDWVIQQFAHALRETLNENSVVARIGGDEFAAYVASLESKEAISVICGRIREAAHAIQIDHVPVTVSIGATFVTSGSDFDTLYKLADQALYAVKANQKDSFSIACEERR